MNLWLLWIVYGLLWLYGRGRRVQFMKESFHGKLRKSTITYKWTCIITSIALIIIYPWWCLTWVVLGVITYPTYCMLKRREVNPFKAVSAELAYIAVRNYEIVTK